jgi:hypothetical protein
VIQFIPALYIGPGRRNFSRDLSVSGEEGECEGGPAKMQTLSSLKASIVRSLPGMNCAGNAVEAEPVCMPNPLAPTAQQFGKKSAKQMGRNAA